MRATKKDLVTYSLLIYHTLQLAQYILNVADLRALDVVLLLEMFPLKSIVIDFCLSHSLF